MEEEEEEEEEKKEKVKENEEKNKKKKKRKECNLLTYSCVVCQVMVVCVCEYPTRLSLHTIQGQSKHNFHYIPIC